MKNINYPVGDYLIRLKNAALSGKHEVSVSKTKLIETISDVLKKEGLIDEAKVKSGILTSRLTFRSKRPVLIDLRLVSKPGMRVYKSVDELEKIKSPSFLILSTPKGIMSSKEAIKKRLGGEVIVEIW